MKKSFSMLVAAILLTGVSAFSHDGGHGPKIMDSGKQGGVVAPVIDAKDAKKGAKAGFVHKAELVRSEDGAVRIYLYDKEMNPLDLSKFDKTAKGVVEFKKSRKWVKNYFTLTQEQGVFVGKAPKSSAKPFNIDVTLKEGGRELLTAFDNLD